MLHENVTHNQLLVDKLHFTASELVADLLYNSGKNVSGFLFKRNRRVEAPNKTCLASRES